MQRLQGAYQGHAAYVAPQPTPLKVVADRRKPFPVVGPKGLRRQRAKCLGEGCAIHHFSTLATARSESAVSRKALPNRPGMVNLSSARGWKFFTAPDRLMLSARMKESTW